MIKNIAVIGAGTMGHGIASCFARYGYEIHIYEPIESMRMSCKDKIKTQFTFLCEQGEMQKADIENSLNNIIMHGDVKQCVEDADYVIEAIPERLELKQELFQKLSEFCKPSAIFATNTSSLSLQEIIKELDEQVQERCMVCHWYNPPHIMPLVELSYFGNMHEETYQTVEQLYRSIEKVPAKVRKDIPGLLANRIQQAIAREVFSLMEMEAADAQDIETALMYGPAFRYATTGQLEVADMGGLDIWSIVGDNLLSVMDDSKQANPLLKAKVVEGKLGFKSGEGFFQYAGDKQAEIQEAFNIRLLNQLRVSKTYQKEIKHD